MKEYEFNIPPDENSPMSRHWTRLMQLSIAIFLAMVVSMNTGGCTQRQIAGRAPTAPALQPVSTRVYSVRLGTLESPAGQKPPTRYDQEFPNESVAATPQD